MTAAAELLTLGVALAVGVVLAAGVCDELAAAELGDFSSLNRKNAPTMMPSTMTAARLAIVHLRTWASRCSRLVHAPLIACPLELTLPLLLARHRCGPPGYPPLPIVSGDRAARPPPLASTSFDDLRNFANRTGRT